MKTTPLNYTLGLNLPHSVKDEHGNIVATLANYALAVAWIKKQTGEKFSIA